MGGGWASIESRATRRGAGMKQFVIGLAACRADNGVCAAAHFPRALFDIGGLCHAPCDAMCHASFHQPKGDYHV